MDELLTHNKKPLEATSAAMFDQTTAVVLKTFGSSCFCSIFFILPKTIRTPIQILSIILR